MDQEACHSAGLKQKGMDTLRFIQRVLLDPAAQFRQMPRQGGFIEPLISIAALGLIAGLLRILVTFYYMMNGAAVSLLAALSSVITTPIMVIVFCYIGAFLLSIIMKYLGADNDLELSFRVTSYLAVVSPLAVIITPIPYLGNVVILGLLAYLLVNAAIEVYQLNSNTAWSVFGIGFAVLAVLSMGAQYQSAAPPLADNQPAAISIEAPAAEQ